MPEIAGKSVTFRKKLPAAQWWPLLPKLASLGEGNPLEVLDWETVVSIIQGTVESWEFDGAPSDPAAIGALDAFQELMPLVQAVAAMIGERTTRLGEAS